MAQYDFNQLYGAADNSFFIYPKGLYDALIVSAIYGMSKDGSKGQWKVEYMITTGPDAGRCKIKDQMTISADNPQALGIMFRQLDAMGVPWQQIISQGGTEEHMAQYMVGKPVQLSLDTREWDGSSRQDVKDIRPPRPGAPTQVPQWTPPPAQQGGFGGQPGFNGQQAYGAQPGPQQGPYGAQPGQQFPGQMFPQPPQGPSQQGFQQQAAAGQVFPGQQPYGGPGPGAMVQGPGGGTVPSGPGGYPQQAQQVQGQIPGAPAWAQPPMPGQGGLAEFTPGGMSQQPSVQQAPQSAPGGPWGQQEPAQQAPQGYGQPAGPQAPFGYPGQPMPGQPQQGYPQQPQQPQQGQAPFGYPGQPQQGPEDPAAGGAPVPPWQQ